MGENWRKPGVSIGLDMGEEGKSSKENVRAKLMSDPYDVPMGRKTQRDMGKYRNSVERNELASQLKPKPTMTDGNKEPVMVQRARERAVLARERETATAARKKANAQLKRIKKLSDRVLKGKKEMIKDAVNKGVIDEASAGVKLAEIISQHKAKLQGIINRIIGERDATLTRINVDKARTYGTRLRDKSNDLDRKTQEVEHELNTINAKKMNAKTKDVLISTLQKKLKTLIDEKERLKLHNARAELMRMTAEGDISPRKAKVTDDKLKKTIHNSIAESKKVRVKTGAIEKSKSRLYVLMKWIDTYRAAIAHAEEMGANWVIIPIDREYGKTGQSTNEIKMSLRNAMVKLAELEQEQRTIENKLGKNKMPDLPPAIIATTPTGVNVTPEMIEAQITYVKSMVSANKMPTIKGKKIVEQLRKVKNLLVYSSRPIVKKKAGNKKPPVNVTVKISPMAVRHIHSGERTIRTKTGSGKTHKRMPKPDVTPSIPYSTSRTPEGTPEKVWVDRSSSHPPKLTGGVMDNENIIPEGADIDWREYFDKEVEMERPQSSKERPPKKGFDLQDILKRIDPGNILKRFWG